MDDLFWVNSCDIPKKDSIFAPLKKQIADVA